MKVAVTGSSGFVGRHLIDELQREGHHVIEIDLRNGIDLSDWDRCKHIERFEVMIHLAAKTFVPDSYNHPRDFYQTNVGGTINALELCRWHEAKMIFASSYVYGEPRYVPIDEAHPVAPFNPYAQTKILGEQMCQAYHRDFGLRVIIFRPFNIYGLGQPSSFLIPAILDQLETGEVALKDSRPKRDLLHVRDLARAYLQAVTYDESPFDIFNIASGEALSVADIAETIARTLAKQVRIRFTDERRPNEVLNTVADISKARALLGWQPRIAFAEGVASLRKVAEGAGLTEAT